MERIILACVGGSNSWTRTVHTIYLEYHSVCSFVGTRTPHIINCKRVCPSPRNQRSGGRVHSPAGEGRGKPNSNDWRKSLALCLLCGWTPLSDSSLALVGEQGMQLSSPALYQNPYWNNSAELNYLPPTPTPLNFLANNITEPESVNLLRSPGIDSQPGGTVSLESIPWAS